LKYDPQARLSLRVCLPAKPHGHSPEAKPMADEQGKAAWGMSGEKFILKRTRR